MESLIIFFLTPTPPSSLQGADPLLWCGNFFPLMKCIFFFFRANIGGGPFIHQNYIVLQTPMSWQILKILKVTAHLLCSSYTCATLGKYFGCCLCFSYLEVCCEDFVVDLVCGMHVADYHVYYCTSNCYALLHCCLAYQMLVQHLHGEYRQ